MGKLKKIVDVDIICIEWYNISVLLMIKVMHLLPVLQMAN